MKSQNETQKLTESHAPHFTIEKLEERIAPKNGGIPGNDGMHGPDHRQGCQFGARPGDC